MISLNSPHKTPYHNYPAALKLVLLCAVTVVLFSIDSIAILLLVLFVSAFMYALCGRLFFVAGFKQLFILWPFVVIVLLWHVLTNTPAQGATIILRLLCAFTFANLVTMTTRLTDMIQVINTVLSPLRRFGFNPVWVGIAIGLVIRFTPVFRVKGAGLYQAWRARSSSRPQLKIVQPFAGLVIDDAEQVAQALRARGAGVPVSELVQSSSS